MESVIQLDRYANADPLFNLPQSARYLNLKNPKTFNVWQSRKKYLDLLTPTYIGNRKHFRKSVLDRFIEARTVKRKK